MEQDVDLLTSAYYVHSKAGPEGSLILPNPVGEHTINLQSVRKHPAAHHILLGLLGTEDEGTTILQTVGNY